MSEDLRKKIFEFQETVASFDQVKIEPKHYFSKGVYAREVTLPKGITAVGKIHKHENLNILSKGDVSIVSAEGMRRIQAPATFVSPPGAKRVVYAHEESVWTTIHGTDERDVEKIEELFIAKTYDDVVWLPGQSRERLEESPCHG